VSSIDEDRIDNVTVLYNIEDWDEIMKKELYVKDLERTIVR
jgi:hypothetical protein